MGNILLIEPNRATLYEPGKRPFEVDIGMHYAIKEVIRDLNATPVDDKWLKLRGFK